MGWVQTSFQFPATVILKHYSNFCNYLENNFNVKSLERRLKGFHQFLAILCC